MADRQDPFRTFNFRLEVDGIAVAAFSDVNGLASEGEVADYRPGMDIPLTNRKPPGLRKYGTIVHNGRGGKGHPHRATARTRSGRAEGLLPGAGRRR